MGYLYIICFLLINISCGHICKKTMFPKKIEDGLSVVSHNKKRRLDIVNDNLNDTARLNISAINKDLLREILFFCDIYSISYFGMVDKYFYEVVNGLKNIYHIDNLEIFFYISPEREHYFYQVVPGKIIEKAQKILLRHSYRKDIIFPKKKCNPDQLIHNVTKGNSLKIVYMELEFIYELIDLLLFSSENLNSLKYGISCLDNIENDIDWIDNLNDILPNLEFVHVVDGLLVDGVIKNLSQCCNLKYLTLDRSTESLQNEIIPFNIGSIKQIPKLYCVCLDFDNCDLESYTTINFIGEPDILKSELESLLIFTSGEYINFGDSIIEFSNLKDLHLNIKLNEHHSEDWDFRFIEKLPKLEELSITMVDSNEFNNVEYKVLFSKLCLNRIKKKTITVPENVKFFL